MLVSFSGPQNSGKTTLLNLFGAEYKDWHVVPEVTRLVKRTYNLPINEGGTDSTQMLIMSEHLRNVCEYQTTRKNTILDRCSLDGLIYTKWLYEQGQVSEDAVKMAEIVYRQTIHAYDIILYPDPHEVKLEDDGERSVDVEFREDIIKAFQDAYFNDVSISCKLYILRGSIYERSVQMREIINTKLK